MNTGLKNKLLVMAAAAGIAGMGVGCGGPMIYPDGIVSPLFIPAWQSFPLRARLALALPYHRRVHSPTPRGHRAWP